MSTSTEVLVAALTDAGDPKLAPMIERAKNGYYHDFKSPLIDPIPVLMEELLVLGHSGLADRAMNGDFDATPEESREWAASPEGQETFREWLRGGQ